MQGRSGAWTEEPWHDSGATETGIPVGQHTVEFSDVAGWTKPGNQTVTISKGQTTTCNRDLYAADRFSYR